MYEKSIFKRLSQLCILVCHEILISPNKSSNNSLVLSIWGNCTDQITYPSYGNNILLKQKVID